MYRIMTDNLLIEKENCLLLQITRPGDKGSKFKRKKDVALTSAKLLVKRCNLMKL